MPLTYSFLDEAAGFPIAESWIAYESTMTFGRAVLVGLINTLVVSAVGIVLATIIGFIVGLARLSSNWLISRLALAYIEFHRNIPLLVLLFLWYFGVFNKFPAVKQSIGVPNIVYINQRGLYIIWPG
jgi:general L-amino acid transport system permease protein